MDDEERNFANRPPPFTLFAYVTKGHGWLKIALLSSCDVKLKAHWSGDTCCWGKKNTCSTPSDNPSIPPATPTPSVCARVLFTTASFLKYDYVHVIVIKRF